MPHAQADAPDALEHSSDQFIASPVVAPPLTVVIRPARYSEAWFLGELFRLQMTSNNRLVYQFGSLGRKFHPNSSAIRLVLARAAVWQGRCEWALGHLRAVKAADPSDLESQNIDLLTSLCLQSWRNDIYVSSRFARHKSLLGVPRQKRTKIAPGSRISSVCSALLGLCDGDGFKSPDYGPTSGSDVWLGLDFMSHKASLEGGDIVNLAMFRRVTTRGGFGGEAVSARYTHYWQTHANKIVYIGVETGSGHFGRGSRLASLAQNHLALDATYARMLGPNQNRFVGDRASKRWLWQVRTKMRLRHTVIMAEQRSQEVTVASYEVSFPIDVLRVDVAMRRGLQIPAHKAIKSLAASMEGSGIMIHGADSWPLLVRVGLDIEVKNYAKALAHLAYPHCERIREVTIGMGKFFGINKQLKVEIILKRKKVSSENKLSAQSDSYVTIYFNYKIQNGSLN